jgi:hypothetical protein
LASVGPENRDKSPKQQGDAGHGTSCEHQGTPWAAGGSLAMLYPPHGDFFRQHCLFSPIQAENASRENF